MLRKGKEVHSEKPKVVEEQEVEKEDEVKQDPPKITPRRSSISFRDNPSLKTPILPYPQRFQKQKLYEQFSKFLEVFEKLSINIPFVEALQKMPNYIKFLREVMSKKKRLEEYETVKLTEECNPILLKKLPQKMKDRRSFTISCMIGQSNFDRSLCDLRASINLIPFSVFKRLGLGKVKSSTTCL